MLQKVFHLAFLKKQIKKIFFNTEDLEMQKQRIVSQNQDDKFDKDYRYYYQQGTRWD